MWRMASPCGAGPGLTDGQGIGQHNELFEYIHPEAIETEPTLPHEIGMHRVAFSVDDIDEALVIAARHGCRRCAVWRPTRATTS